MPLPALIAMGYILGSALAPHLTAPAWIGYAALVPLAVALVYLVAKHRGHRVALLLLCSTIAGWSARSWQAHEQGQLVQTLENRYQVRNLSGVVLADHGTPLHRRKLTVATEIGVGEKQRRAKIHIHLREVAASLPRFQPGTQIRFRVRLKPFTPAWMAGQFDARQLWLARGIVAKGYISKSRHLVVMPQQAQPWHPIAALQRLRQHLATTVDQALPAEASAFTRAMVLGDRSDIDQDLRLPFDGAGAGHLLAVSGLHVGTFAVLVFALAGFFCRRWDWLARRLPPRRFASICAAPAGICFALVAGGSPSALRAGFMALAIFTGLALWRERAVWSSLGLAALGILAISPAAVSDPSFILSFTAVSAILYATPRIIEFSTGNRILDPESLRVRLVAACAATLAAGLVSLPLSAYFFGKVAIYGVLANLFIVPIAGVALPVIICSTLLGCLLLTWGGWLVDPGALLLQAGAALILSLRDICGFFAGLPASLIEVKPPPLIAVLLLLAGGALFLTWFSRPRWRPATIATLLLGSLFAWSPAYDFSGKLRLYFLPVGQGDATLMVTPNGKTLLLDTPGLRMAERDPGQQVVLPFLRHNGIHQLDVVVISHPDYDHYGGLASVLTDYCPAELWWTGQIDKDPAWQHLQAVLQQCQTRLRTFHTSDNRLTLDGVDIEVLHPLVAAEASPAYWPEFGKNDNSLVLLIKHGQHSFLLPGDAGQMAEDSLLDSGKLGSVDVLKCGHHGSAHSSTPAFLQAIKPKHAVISAGFCNRFGHPRPIVLQRLQEVDSQIWRTDRHGLVAISSDGEQLEVEPYIDVSPRPPVAEMP